MDTSSKEGALRRIELRRPPRGEPLPGCLFDHAGQVLMRSGLILDGKQSDELTQIAHSGICVGLNWA